MKAAVLLLHTTSPGAREAELKLAETEGLTPFVIKTPFTRCHAGQTTRGQLNPESELALWEKTANELDSLIAGPLASFPFRGVLGLNLGGSFAAYWIVHRKPKIDALVLAGVLPDLKRFWRQAPQDPLMKEMDLGSSIRKIRDIPILAQFGTADPWIPQTDVDAFEKRCPNVQVQKLADDHAMSERSSVERRIQWLKKRAELNY